MIRRLLLAALLASGPLAAQELDGAAVMARLESRLLAASRVTIEATIESRGFVTSNLKGRSEWLDRNRATWAYAGNFAGKLADLALTADGQVVQLRNGAQSRDEPLGAEGNRAALLGLTRMGLLHNLARLTGLRGADHAQGGTDGWVKLDSFRPTTFAQGGELEGMMSFGFDIVVAGNPSGSARVWFDPATSLPRRRQQTVRFPQGEMTVTEDYTRFEVQ
jgi:hypothetical protein